MASSMDRGMEEDGARRESGASGGGGGAASSSRRPATGGKGDEPSLNASSRGPNGNGDSDASANENGNGNGIAGDTSTTARGPDSAAADQESPTPSGQGLPTGTVAVAGGATFVPLRTAKACDMCKIRKVKCDGDQPCASCKLHQARCVYSKTTRKNLLSQGGAIVVPASRASTSLDNAAASGSRVPNSAQSSSFRSEPQYYGGGAGGDGFGSPGPGPGAAPYGQFPYPAESSRSRRDSDWEGAGPRPSTTREKDRAAYDLNQSRSLWQRDDGGDYERRDRAYPIDPELEPLRGGSVGDQHGIRRPYPGFDGYDRSGGPMYGEPPYKRIRTDSPRQSMRGGVDDPEVPGSSNNPFAASTHPGTRPGIPYDEAPSRTLSHTDADRSRGPPNFASPAGFFRSMDGREASNALMSASDSMPDSSTGHHDMSIVSRGPHLQQYGRNARMPGVDSPSQSGNSTSQTRTGFPDSNPTSDSSRSRLRSPVTADHEFSPFPMGYGGTHEGSSGRRNTEVGPFIGVPRNSMFAGNAGEDPIARSQDGHFAGRDDYRGPDQSKARAAAMLHHPITPEPPPPRIVGAEGDLLGNAGITTFQPGRGTGGLCWWGPTSFLCLQDRLIHMLKLKMQARPGTLINGTFRGGKMDEAGRPELNVWRWGSDKLLFQDTLGKGERTAAEARYDPMFLPSDLAYRFFRSYSVVVHPLLPLFNLDVIRASIGQAYSGGASLPQPGASQLHQEEIRVLTKARDSIVLALGAQIEGGDGDADCPKDLSRRWSGILAAQSRQLMAECTTIYHNADAIKIWILDATFSSNRGIVEEEFMTVGKAARLAVSLGLHREPTCALPGAAAESLREAFWICYVSEKLVSTSHGRPSCMNLISELDSVPPPATTDAMKCQVALIGMTGILEQVHSLYISRNASVSILSAIDKGLVMDRALNRYRLEMISEFRNFDHLAEDVNTTPTTQAEVERAYLNFHICMVYHHIRILAFLPLLSFAAWQDVQEKGDGQVPDQCQALAEKCVESAKAIILAFDFYLGRVPYLPYHGAFAFRFLYALPVIYLDVLRTNRNSQPRDHVRVIRKAAATLEHLDHPAADVAKAMVEDLFTNHLRSRYGGEIHNAVALNANLPPNIPYNLGSVPSTYPTSGPHPDPSSGAGVGPGPERGGGGSAAAGSGLLFGGNGAGGMGPGAGGANMGMGPLQIGPPPGP